MQHIRCSLIISTYNWPGALELCLLSVKQQVTLPDEVIIADDGSGEETLHILEKLKPGFPVPLKRIWHPDEGFRLARIRNKAIAAASGDYIIQVDGDLILHHYFIDDHLRFAKPGTFVRASRIYLNQELSEQAIAAKRTRFSVFEKGLSNKLSALHIPFLWNYFEFKYKAHQPYEIHGCNMAFWRADAIDVNGYNEEFNGWGPEDKEFIVRLLNKGLHKRFIKLGALVFHLYHPVSSKNNLVDNEHEFHASINLKRDFCINGIDQHL